MIIDVRMFSTELEKNEKEDLGNPHTGQHLHEETARMGHVDLLSCSHIPVLLNIATWRELDTFEQRHFNRKSAQKSLCKYSTAWFAWIAVADLYKVTSLGMGGSYSSLSHDSNRAESRITPKLR